MGKIAPEMQLGVAFSGAVFYGIYLITLAQCLRWQLFTDKGWMCRQRRNWPMIIVTFLIFISTTVYLSLGLFEHTKDLHHIIYDIPSTLPPGKVAWTETAICFTANATALLADTAFIYRCWRVYGKRRRFIIFPIIMWLAGLVCSALEVYWQTMESNITPKWKWVNMSVGPGIFLTPFWATTLLINAYVMFMIIYLIRDASRNSYETRNIRTLRATTQILAESGFLYFSTTIAHFIVWWTPNDLAISIASNINIPTIGIAFNLILIRVGQNRAEERKKTGKVDQVGVTEMRFASETMLDPTKEAKLVTIVSQETSRSTWDPDTV